MIKNIINFMEKREKDKHEWPIDSQFNRNIKKSLSHSKMVNEINHRMPRQYSLDGFVERIPVCGSRSGCHSTTKRYRRSTLGQLGPGINLYLKKLKYIGTLFLVSSILSIPTYLVFSHNSSSVATSGMMGWMHYLSLGSMQAYKTVVTAGYDLEPTKKETSMLLQCPDNSLHSNVVHFGLATFDSQIYGDGLNQRITTVQNCSLGGMKDVRKEFMFEETYNR